MANKQRVVILGGGVGAMSAAFAITSLPDWKERFESVDVYQLGWRLGGKGASGREQHNHDRVLEHGIHLWMGFYENAFRVMRELYAELDRPPGAPLRTVWEAFTPQNQVGVTGPLDADAGTWSRWWVDMPVGPGTPGDGTDVLPLPSGMLLRLMELLKACALHLVDPDKHPLPMQVEVVGETQAPSQWPGIQAVSNLYVGLEAALSHLRVLDAAGAGDHAALLDAVASLRAGFQAAIPPLLHRHPRLLMVWQVFDIGLAMVKGMVTDGVLARGFDAIDGEDWLDWLRRHGLTEVSANAPLIRAGYDLVFAYPDGRDRPPRFAAGAMTRSLLRIALSYKGSIMYHMAAGMGDAVFAPFHEVLQKRGVRFFYFHKVTDIRTDAAGTTVTAIHMQRQVNLRAAKPWQYRPLYDVKGLPCWPSEPLWDQIKNGARLRAAHVDLESAWNHTAVADIELRLGVDFDQVVLGIPVAALQHCAKGIITNNSAFARMVAEARSVEVLAQQAWLRPDGAGLGMTRPGMVMTGEAPVSDTYADMSPVLARESWGNTPEDPRSLAYFCGALSGPVEAPLADPHYPARRLAQGLRQADALYRNRSGRLWPEATSDAYPDGTDPKHFVAPAGTPDQSRWHAQYTRVNIDPHERFNLTMPGTTQNRLWPHDNGFVNLALAGDWTRNPINAACVEGSAMSGLLAARKVTGHGFPVAGASDFPALQAPGVPDGTGSLPAMVEQIGVTSGPGPLQLTGCKALMLLFPAEPAALTAWVDAYFNEPTGSGIQFRPLTSAVLMQWAVMDSIASTDPVLGPELGWFKETDCGLWVPVGRGRQVGDWFIVDQLYLAPAILFVDHPTGHTSGRESWGYPKQQATFRNPTAPNQPGPFTADVHVVAQPNGNSAPRRLFTVRSLAAAPGSRPFADGAEAVAQLLAMLVGTGNQHLLPGVQLLGQVGQLLHETVPTLFLKQLRDSVQVDRACYQQLQQCDMTTQFRAGQPLGPYQLAIKNYFRHPLAATLGLRDVNHSVAAAWLEFDAQLSNSRPVPGA